MFIICAHTILFSAIYRVFMCAYTLKASSCIFLPNAHTYVQEQTYEREKKIQQKFSVWSQLFFSFTVLIPFFDFLLSFVLYGQKKSSLETCRPSICPVQPAFNSWTKIMTKIEIQNRTKLVQKRNGKNDRIEKKRHKRSE